MAASGVQLPVRKGPRGSTPRCVELGAPKIGDLSLVLSSSEVSLRIARIYAFKATFFLLKISYE
jgi:hypothetical protein